MTASVSALARNGLLGLGVGECPFRIAKRLTRNALVADAVALYIYIMDSLLSPRILLKTSDEQGPQSKSKRQR